MEFLHTRTYFLVQKYTLCRILALIHSYSQDLQIIIITTLRAVKSTPIIYSTGPRTLLSRVWYTRDSVDTRRPGTFHDRGIFGKIGENWGKFGKVWESLGKWGRLGNIWEYLERLGCSTVKLENWKNFTKIDSAFSMT